MNKYKQALQQISSLWPEPPNCADILSVNGINDGKSRAILLEAAINISRKALQEPEGFDHNTFQLTFEALTVIKDFLEWGAKTGSDRDLFDTKFRKILTKAGIEFNEPEY